MLRPTKESLITAPTVEPISVEEAALHCRITPQDEYSYLQTLITAARKRLENVCWSAFVTQTWKYWLDSFNPQKAIPRSPLISVSWLKYIASDGAEPTTVASTVYETAEQNGISFLRLKYNQTWPSRRGYYDDVTLQVVCGYGATADSVPEPIRHALKLYVGHLYMNRGDEPAELPKPIWDLLEDYRFKEF
jgi:uncharacterized phiE125 gp8 family phage protein